MILRIIIGITLTVIGIGFLWFMSQVILLGLKEFFKIHSQGKNTNTNTETNNTQTNNN